MRRPRSAICVIAAFVLLGGCGGGGSNSGIPAFDGPKTLLDELAHKFPPKPASPNPAPKGTGVYGYVLVEPACRTSNQPCDQTEQYALATIAAKDSKSGDTKAGITGATGRFIVPLRPGTYSVGVASASAPGLEVKLCHPSNVLVVKGSFSYLILSCVGA